MVPDSFRRLTIVAVLLVLTVGLLAAGPASANDRTERVLAGVAAGLIIGAALSDHGDRDRCYGGYYPPPPPRYDPPRGYYYPSPRQSYNQGYRDGFADGSDYGRHQGYAHGYRDGRTDQWYADSYGRRSPAGYRPPRPVCW